jgi:hypothetical protein
MLCCLHWDMVRPVLDKLEGELVVATEVINWAVLLGAG